MRKRVGVLASGGGSNLQAILDHLSALGEARAADVVFVASDRAGSGALIRARAHGVESVLLDSEQSGEGLLPLLQARELDLIALAGYLRLVPAVVTVSYRGRLVNVHPALLPAFGGPGMYGRRVHEAVLARGARVSGATVHFVDERFDHGPIIAQWPVMVLPADTAPSLAARVLEVEHALYPRTIQALASDRVVLDEEGRVRHPGVAAPGGHFTTSEDASPLIRALDTLLASHD